MGLVECYHQTLIDRMRKLRFIHGGSWVVFLEPAVEALNGAVHSVTKCSLKELWNGSQDMRELPRYRTVKERGYRNEKHSIRLVKFYPGQIVLVWNETPGVDRFCPGWKGPFILTRKISSSLWEGHSRKPQLQDGSPYYGSIKISYSPLICENRISIVNLWLF